MAAVTPEYFEFTGPGFLTLVQNHTLVGKADVQYQDANGDWKRLYDADKNPVQIGWPCETVKVDVPDGTVWRVASPFFDCDVSDTLYSFYNSIFENIPVFETPDYLGSPIRCDNKAYRGGYTTYYQMFTGTGMLCIVDPGQLASAAEVYIDVDGTPENANKYYVDGEPVILGTGTECAPVFYEGDYIIKYQVANCFEDDVVFSLTPIDMTGGDEPPVEPPVFTGTIPDISGDVGEPITPYDASTHFTDATSYSLANAPADIVIDPVTAMISGAGVAEGLTAGLVVTGTNEAGSADSNAFSADITLPIPITEAIEVVGLEGTWGPWGYDPATIPADLAAMAPITTPNPDVWWSNDSFMTLGDASLCHWNGTAWTVGVAVLPFAPDLMVVQMLGFYQPSTFELPFTGVHNLTIDWGDGVIEENVTALVPSHTGYTGGVPYTITIAGTATIMSPENATVGNWNQWLYDVIQFGTMVIPERADSFASADRMAQFSATDVPLGIVNMEGMLTNNTYMFGPVISLAQWDVSAVTNASRFLTNSNEAWSVEGQYDEVLTAWGAQVVITGVTCDFGSTAFKTAAGQAGYDSLVAQGWLVNDGDLGFQGIIPDQVGQVGVAFLLDAASYFRGMTSYSISQPPPSGVIFDTVTGLASGTPDSIVLAGSLTPYTITGTNGTDTRVSNEFDFSVE